MLPNFAFRPTRYAFNFIFISFWSVKTFPFNYLNLIIFPPPLYAVQEQTLIIGF